MILKYIRKNKKAIMKFSMSFMLCCFIFLAAVPAYAGATGSKSNVSQQDTEDSFHLNITSNAGSTTLESITNAFDLNSTFFSSFHHHYGDLFYENHRGISFSANSFGNADHTAKSGVNRTCSFYDISNYVSGYDKSEQRGSSALYEWKSKAGTGDRKRTGSNSDVYVKTDKRQRSQIVYDD